MARLEHFRSWRVRCPVLRLAPEHGCTFFRLAAEARRGRPQALCRDWRKPKCSLVARELGRRLRLDPWYLPRYMIPLAGMVFANAMTAVSLAAERLFAELGHGDSWEEARKMAFQAAMIPVVNSLFAVGLVSLPGMMTGQILSGVSPLIAARYQIMVMCMIFASAGISTAIFLTLARRRVK